MAPMPRCSAPGAVSCTAAQLHGFATEITPSTLNTWIWRSNRVRQGPIWDAALIEKRSHRYGRALRLVERGLELDSAPEVHFDLVCAHGDLLRELGRVDQSIATFERALTAPDGDHQVYRANIGMAEGLRLNAKYKEGLTYVARAEQATGADRSADQHSYLHHLKGNLLFPLGEAAACFAEQEKGAQIWPRVRGGGSTNQSTWRNGGCRIPPRSNAERETPIRGERQPLQPATTFQV